MGFVAIDRSHDRLQDRSQDRLQDRSLNFPSRFEVGSLALKSGRQVQDETKKVWLDSTPLVFLRTRSLSNSLITLNTGTHVK